MIYWKDVYYDWLIGNKRNPTTAVMMPRIITVQAKNPQITFGIDMVIIKIQLILMAKITFFELEKEKVRIIFLLKIEKTYLNINKNWIYKPTSISISLRRRPSGPVSSPISEKIFESKNYKRTCSVHRPI